MSDSDARNYSDAEKGSPVSNRLRWSSVESAVLRRSASRSRSRSVSRSGSEARKASDVERVVDEQEPDVNSLHDSEEDESDSGHRRKRKKKDRYDRFIIDEAEVDDKVEGKDKWEEGAQEIGIVGNEVDELAPTAREIEGRRRGTYLWDSQMEHEIEEYFRKKYADDG